jgi:cyclic-di-GMP phosphodiesterase TipF (flagellum assembly factor)
MSALKHILIAACYTIVAAGVAVGLPAFFSALDVNAGVVIGGVVLVGSAVLQEGESRLLEELDSAREEVAAVRNRLAEAETQMEQLRAALNEVDTSEGDAEGRRKVDDVIAEVKVLQGLIEQFSTAKVAGGGPRPAAAPRPAPSRPAPPPPPAEIVVDAAAAADDADDMPDRREPTLSEPKRNLSLVASEGAVVTPPPRPEPDIAPDMLRGLSDDAILGIVRDGLESNRVDLVLQPVVSLPQRKRCF